jgi:catechol 2,3-dioxygenase-like lactoylglutathione lyase family enzyme
MAFGFCEEAPMLAYTVLGSNNKEKAIEFYDAIFGELGAKRVFNTDRLEFYSDGKGGAMLAIGTPANLEAATVGNGVMPAIGAPDKETVDKVYKLALEMGAKSAGYLADRPGFYGAYFRDPDGNRLCVCKLG